MDLEKKTYPVLNFHYSFTIVNSEPIKDTLNHDLNANCYLIITFINCKHTPNHQFNDDS